MQQERAKVAEPERRVLVFIPSFGDTEVLPSLLADIDSLGPRYHALVVDDGSPVAIDRPRESRYLMVRLPANLGLGATMGIAFSHALAFGYAAVVRIDADGQHRVADIPRLLRIIDEGAADMVVGIRVNQHQDNPSWARRLLKAYLGFVARVSTDGAVPTDVNSGFFAVGRHAIRSLRTARFERFPEPDLFVSACLAGLRVASVDIEQGQRQHGRSTINVVSAARVLFRFNVFAVGYAIRRVGQWFIP